MLRRSSAIAIGVLLIAAVAYADGPTADDLLGNGPADVLAALAEIQSTYGMDAALLQSQLIGSALQAGSVGEISVGVAGFEERDGKRYLAYTVATGIVYNDRDMTPGARLNRTWSRMVDRTIRQRKTLDIAADGLVFRTTSAHKSYADEADLRDHLADDPGTVESVDFYLSTADIAELLAGRLTGQELADRSQAWYDGQRQIVTIEPIEPTATPVGPTHH